MRFDSGFKDAGIRDPRGLLYMAGRLGLEDPAEVVPFEREIVAPQKIADSLFQVREVNGSVRFEQLEALTRWHIREQEAILQRVATVLLLRELDDAELHLTIVLLSAKGVPEPLPPLLNRKRSAGEVVIRPSYVRLWELDGREYVRLGRPSLLPWVPLMRADPEVVQNAAFRIYETGDESLASQFVTLGSLCYSKDDLRRMIGRIAPMFTTELAMQTPVGEEILHVGFERGIQEGIERGIERGIEQGIERGIEQGRRQAVVHSLRLFLASRFPALEHFPGVSKVAGAADPEAILDAVYKAADETAARAVLQGLIES